MFQLVHKPGECLIFVLSSEPKPSPYGHFLCFEMDTGKVYHAENGEWVKVKAPVENDPAQ